MKKHILFVMVGTSPAVITETVWELWQQKNFPVEVHCITTQKGKDIINQELFSGSRCKWKEMCEDNNMSVTFGPANIHTLSDDEAGYCQDITTSQHNTNMADEILRILRGFTEDNNCKISFSIAGGRKSMTAIGALVMSLLGRKDDKLYHILVNSPFDSALEPNFYYPSSTIHKARDGQKYCGTDAKLQLAEIPYVRCRYWLSGNHTPDCSYSALVNQLNGSGYEIVINVPAKSVQVNNHSIRLNYKEIHLFWCLTTIFKNGENWPTGLQLKNAFYEFLTKQGINIQDSPPRQGQHRDFITAKDLDIANITRIKSEIKRKLNNESEEEILNDKRFNYKIEPENITIILGDR